MIKDFKKYSMLAICSALLLGVPPVINGGHFFSFDQAQAAKGGKGGGKSSNAGGQSAGKSSKAGGQSAGKSSKAGGQSAGKSSNAGGQSAGKSSNSGGKASATKTASVDKKDGGATMKSKKAAGSQKASTSSKGSKGASKKKEVAAAEGTAPNKNSALGRWNAVKPLEHPAVQAHILNGNFNGTIGLNAAYVLAQDTYDKIQAAQAVVAANDAQATLDDALKTYNEDNGDEEDFTTVEAFVAAVKNGEIDVDEEVSTEVLAAAETLAKELPADSPTLDGAEALLSDPDAEEKALTSLEEAEAAMALASNRGDWEDIRGDVRVKMGLLADEDDVAAAKAAAEAAAAEAAAADAASDAPEATDTTEVSEPTEPTEPAEPTETTETTELPDELPVLEETAAAQ